MIQTELGPLWRFSCRSWLRQPQTLGFSKREWLPATVPGHVHLDLAENGVIGDPFVDLREIGCQWVDAEDWVYATEFEFQPHEQLPRRVLRFDGLDTVCTVMLNGVTVGTHDNMFTPLELDVSAHLKSGVNSLEVHFEAATRVGTERRRAYFQAEGLPLETVRFDERAFVRKADYMFGWDWGPRLVSAGIWKPVRLIEFMSRVVEVQVRQTHLESGHVCLECHAEIEGPGKAVHFVRFGAQVIACVSNGGSLTLERPSLWWPLGMGPQPMYEVETLIVPSDTSPSAVQQLVADDSSPVEHQGTDRRLTRIGLRRIELVKEPDQFGESFRFQVNGRRLWCFGANWIPDHSFPSRITRTRLRQQLMSAADLRMNMLRVWGGGVYESDDFYDLCDELGILVWQDFPFACSYAPDDAAAQEVVKTEAAANVRRLRNHASLALWCGNNENLMMFQNKWDDATKHPPRYYGEPIWHQTLPHLLSELDPTRPYLPTSPHLGESANADQCGDQHNWDVWHGRGDWAFYSDSKARFPSEYGFASAPGRGAWERMFSEGAEYAQREVDHPVARWHDKTKKGHETFIGFVELHYPRATNLRAWTYTSQLNQRDALRHALEHYRRSHFAAGSLIWQLNDCWPVQSWSVIDSTGAYKAAAFELRRLHAPLLAAVELIGAGPCAKQEASARPLLRVWAIHDNSASNLTDELLVELRDSLTGAVIKTWRRRVTLEPSDRFCALEVSLENFALHRTLLWVTFGGYQSVRPLCEPKDMHWHVPQWRARRTAEGLLLQSDGPVIDALIEPLGVDTMNKLGLANLPEAGSLILPYAGYIERVAVTTLSGTVEVDAT